MKLLFSIIIAIILFSIIYPITSFAGSGIISVQNVGLNVTANAAGLPSRSDITVIVGDVLAIVLGFLGTLFLVLVVIGGITWMTAAGNEDQVRKAKSMIMAAVLGLVVIFLSYTFARVLGSILSVV
ncbi:MAG: hypothetical protein US74_C0002G0002 [Parcubacteria group bacterium GW2011_GWA2_38_13]|nr:MAG: hypothetical protein US74_C0002G0002 [Parcubacteria group bacterium GW2011_GWA2_38_13]